MADKNTTPKKVFNPLLNASVTGATLEEFTQNAILLPAAPQPQPQTEVLEQIPLNNPVKTEGQIENVPLNQESRGDNIFTPNFNQPPTVPNPFYDQYQSPVYNNQFNNNNQFQNNQFNNNPQFITHSTSAPELAGNSGDYQQSFTPPVSNLNSSITSSNDSSSSSILSSFSNILTFGAPKKKEIIETNTPIKSAVEQLLSTPGEATVNPVPLFNPTQTNFGAPSVSPGLLPPDSLASTSTAPPTSIPGSSNTFRRQTQKKLTYAPIPGFSAQLSQAVASNQNIEVDKTFPASTFQSLNIPFPPPPGSQPEAKAPNFFNTLDTVSNGNSQIFPNPISEATPTNFINPTPGAPPTNFLNPTPGAPPTNALNSTTGAQSTNFLIPTSEVPSSFLIPSSEAPSNLLIPTSEPILEQKTNNYFSQQTFESQTSSFSISTSEANPSPFLIPTSEHISESKPTPFLTPLSDTAAPTFFSGFIMSNTSGNDIKLPTNPATLNSTTTTVRSISPMTTPDAPTVASVVKPNAPPYRPVYHHWFHRKEIEGRVIWIPFSMVDSLALEASFVSTDLSPEHMVATDGGRYDVNILRRQRSAVYWEGTPTEVRRCSWFYKANNDGRFTPYEENIATKLEEEYKAAYEVNQWHRKVDLTNGETVVFHAPDVLVVFPQSATPDMWNNTTQTALRPRVVKRGMDEFDIDEGEPTKIDHLLFLVHGIGSVCDLKFRSVEEVVDDFRSISLQLVQSHYKSSCEQGLANRIEVLPVSWHNQLHSEDTGIDKKLKSITLESIPKLRDFTNDTLLDILFYTSPIYCQTIISTVGTELNRIYELFKARNPGFKGSISLGGHSLGSLILFDILCHQHPSSEKDDEETGDGSEEDTVPPMRQVKKPPPPQRRLSRRISYMMGKAGTGQPQLTYPHLNFTPIAFFALGSPIGMFVTVRGLESLGEQFALPTCPAFFNIFHPYDPVAYRIESLINPDLGDVRPVLIPHHKGRKRMHLELKETMARVGADLKQRVMDSMKNTWNSFYQFTMFHRQDTKTLEAEVNKVLEEQLNNEETLLENEETPETDLSVGILNNGRRIDYVLQEAPFEFFNEYIFALTSHVCYWESEDTMLLILKEIYSSMGISTDSQIPQQTMKIERATPSPSRSTPGSSTPRSLQMADPLRPMVFNANQGPPPTSGFIRKT